MKKYTTIFFAKPSSYPVLEESRPTFKPVYYVFGKELETLQEGSETRKSQD